jgi:antitoxin MazE
MKSRIESVHSELALIIPREIAAEAGLIAGRDVEVTFESGAIVIHVAGKVRYMLADLVAQITDGNLHGETDWGPAIGREIW